MYPAISADGETIIFASDSKGEGGLDLFSSHLKNGKWSVPRNLGPMINTALHDAFPYLHPDGRLFFASKGHIGFGGFDLFVSNYDSTSGDWTKPINLGQPINSPSDDFSFAFAPGDQIGTFTSTRGSGNDDIYFFWFGAEPAWPLVFQTGKQETLALDTLKVESKEPQTAQEVEMPSVQATEQKQNQEPETTNTSAHTPEQPKVLSITFSQDSSQSEIDSILTQLNALLQSGPPTDADSILKARLYFAGLKDAIRNCSECQIEIRTPHSGLEEKLLPLLPILSDDVRPDLFCFEQAAGAEPTQISVLLRRH